jgi:hypothetical protein
MNKFIQLFIILLSSSVGSIFAQNSNNNNSANGYYQTINLDDKTPCNCNEKTQRTYDLAKGLRPKEISNYNLVAYKFTFGNSTLPASKLFKAMEKDPSIYKVSLKEWDSFMLLTTKDFNINSFEAAGIKAFGSFSKISLEAFLKTKSSEIYNEYLQLLEKNRLLELEKNQTQNGTH